MMSNIEESEEVLLLTPTSVDSRIAVEVLSGAGISASAFESLSSLCERMLTDCGAVVIAEEMLTRAESSELVSILANQEAWSDLPIILLTGHDIYSATEMFTKSGNISLLERPFSRLTLIKSVEVALRARRRQYEVRSLIQEQVLATQKRDEFFATLSHELRTPLNVMLGWLEILRAGKLDEVSHKDALETLERNAKTQKNLIDDLLDVSRIVTGKLQMELAPLSLSELVRGCMNSFSLRAREKNLSLHFSESCRACPVLGDEQRLSQVISNLLTNSIKFTPPNGKIVVSINETETFYELTVVDTGQGVDPEFLPKMFHRLKQENMTTTRTHGGMGLGLAIASHIVKEHNGSIEAFSEGRGKGMKITVRFPVLGKDQTASSASTPHMSLVPAETSLEGIRVLVVDDSPDILKLIDLWLGHADAEVLLSSSAHEALEKLSDFRPDVLLSDIGMPEVDGYQLIAKIRERKDGYRDIPAIALTAYARDEERIRSIKAGFHLHISKPIARGTLVSAIGTLIQSNQLKTRIN